MDYNDYLSKIRKLKEESSKLGEQSLIIVEKMYSMFESLAKDYVKLQEDFESIDHECFRLENIDIEKDLKIKQLEEDISNMYNEETIISIISDEFNVSNNEVRRLSRGEEQ